MEKILKDDDDEEEDVVSDKIVCDQLFFQLHEVQLQETIQTHIDKLNELKKCITTEVRNGGSRSLDYVLLRKAAQYLLSYTTSSTKKEEVHLHHEIKNFVHAIEKKNSSSQLHPAPLDLHIPKSIHENMDNVHVTIQMENGRYRFLYDESHSDQDKKLLDFYVNEFLNVENVKTSTTTTDNTASTTEEVNNYRFRPTADHKIDCIMRLSDILARKAYKRQLFQSLVRPHGLDTARFNEIAKNVWFVRAVHPNMTRVNSLRYIFENDNGKIVILTKQGFINYWGKKQVSDVESKKRVRMVFKDNENSEEEEEGEEE